MKLLYAAAFATLAACTTRPGISMPVVELLEQKAKLVGERVRVIGYLAHLDGSLSALRPAVPDDIDASRKRCSRSEESWVAVHISGVDTVEDVTPEPDRVGVEIEPDIRVSLVEVEGVLAESGHVQSAGGYRLSFAALLTEASIVRVFQEFCAL